jgi:hypothetical protein
VNGTLKRLKAHPLGQIVIGLATYVPGFYRAFSKTGGTNSARYCYTVWLRHLIAAHERGLCSETPRHVAELGPGDSLGIGMAALLSGSESYHALDIVAYSHPSRNLRIFSELVELFHRRADLPGEEEFPLVSPRLNSYKFPSHILSVDHVDEALSAPRLQHLRDAISGAKSSPLLSYIVPWHEARGLEKLSHGLAFDMIFSQATLEHVDDLSMTYAMLYQWLKPGGFMSHDIDFTSHGTHIHFNGHYTYPPFVWKLIRGRRAYLVNRQPPSTHWDLMRRCNFQIVHTEYRTGTSRISREKLPSEFRAMSDEDLCISSAFVQAVKQARPNEYDSLGESQCPSILSKTC